MRRETSNLKEKGRKKGIITIYNLSPLSEILMILHSLAEMIHSSNYVIFFFYINNRETLLNQLNSDSLTSINR